VRNGYAWKNGFLCKIYVKKENGEISRKTNKTKENTNLVRKNGWHQKLASLDLGVHAILYD
jgi:hypothetical protein